MKKSIIVGLIVGVSQFALANPAIIPPNYTSGAVLNHWMFQQQYNRTSPWVLGPSNTRSILNEPTAEAQIEIDEDVLPSDATASGIMKTPNGKVYIVGPQY